MIEKGYYNDGNLKNEIHYRNGMKHNEKGPAIINYRKNGSIESKEWYQNNLLHNVNGPAVKFFDQYGNVIKMKWYIYGKEFFKNKNT